MHECLRKVSNHKLIRRHITFNGFEQFSVFDVPVQDNNRYITIRYIVFNGIIEMLLYSTFTYGAFDITTKLCTNLVCLGYLEQYTLIEQDM